MTTPFDYIRLRVWHTDGSVERHEPKFFKSREWFESRVGRVQIGSNIKLSSDRPVRFALVVGHHFWMDEVFCAYYSHERAPDGSDVFVILADNAQYLISSLVGDANFEVALDEDAPGVLSFSPDQGTFPEDTPPPFPHLTFNLVEDDEGEI